MFSNPYEFVPSNCPKWWRGEVANWSTHLPSKYRPRFSHSLESAIRYSQQHGEDDRKLVHRMANTLLALERYARREGFMDKIDSCCIRDYAAFCMKYAGCIDDGGIINREKAAAFEITEMLENE